MGIIVNAGELFKRSCRACKEEVIVKASGADICCCPYCGNILTEHEAGEADVQQSLDQVQQAIMQYRNATDPHAKESYKLILKNRLYWLNADLEYCKNTSS